MSVGNQNTKANMDNQLTQYAVQLRNLMQQIRSLDTQVNSAPAGAAAYLTAIGYTDTADQADALSLLDIMDILVGLYYGTVTANVTVSGTAPSAPAAGDYWVNSTGGGGQQPGQLNRWTGTAWAAFSVDTALSVLWGGG